MISYKVLKSIKKKTFKKKQQKEELSRCEDEKGLVIVPVLEKESTLGILLNKREIIKILMAVVPVGS